MSETEQLSFNGRVAVVTGAGGGLGREYALLFASRGASVVVNDLGSSRSGEGNNSKAADIVVNEIKEKGGKAVANYDSVEEGEKIVQTAIKNFGRIDILVNNAGILRDKSFTKITEADWDIVNKVHLKGAFSVTRAAWPYFRQQNFGRIVMTSSAAGLFGNFGQSNYSSAKLGLVGLSNTLAVEGEKYNINCNSIVPVAASRLTEDILPPNLFEQLKPSFTAPIVVWLCHESCKETGGIFEAAGGWAGKYRLQRSSGKTFPIDKQLTPELVRDYWSQVVNMQNPTYPKTIHHQMSDLMNNLTNADIKPPVINEAKDVNEEIGVYSYKESDAIFYALSVGASTKENENLKYIYENDENFSVLPNLAVNPALKTLFDYGVLNETCEKLNIKYDLTKTLHGEHYLEMYKPLGSSGLLKSEKPIVVDVLDKGSGAVMIIGVDTLDETGEKVCYNQFQLFLVGAGNFGGNRSSNKSEIKSIIKPPMRQPDATIIEQTLPDQAAMFRLNGDKNPLHIDPLFATIGGFSKPILHGLCSLGFATRHILKTFADNDPKKVKSIKARFSGSIFPGETIQTMMWKEGNRVHFESIVKETGKPLISGGYIELQEVFDARKISVNEEDVNKVDSAFDGLDSDSFISDTIFEEMERRITMVPNISSKVNAIFQFNLFKDLNKSKTKTWTMDLKSPNGSLYSGISKSDPPSCIIEASDNDFTALAIGELDPIKGFMNGQIKIQGNPMLTEKLKILFEQDSSLLYDENFKAPEMSAAPNPPPQMIAPPSQSGSSMQMGGNDGDGSGASDKCLIDDIFDTWGTEKLDGLKELIPSIKTVYLWNITKGGKVASVWTCDFKNGNGAIYRGTPKIGKADCTLTIDDNLVVKIFEGKEDAMKSFMSGKLKISGNILAAQKLQRLWDEEGKNSEKPQIGKKSSESKATQQATSEDEDEDIKNIPTSGLKADLLFCIFKSRMHEEPDYLKRLRVVFQFNILKNGKPSCIWTVDNRTNEFPDIYRSPPPSTIKVDCLITIEDDDLLRILTGKVNPQRYFMLGKVKIKGNVMLIQKLNTLWLEYQKLDKIPEFPFIIDILINEPLIVGLKSEMMVIELIQRMFRLPSLRQEIPGEYVFEITKNGKVESKWTLSVKPDVMTFARGALTDKPKSKVTVEDIDFSKIVLMKLKIADAITNKKVKVEGDTNSILKLHQLFTTCTSLKPKL